MRTYLECIPCFVRQALDAARLATSDLAVHERVLRETLRWASEMSFDQSPPSMGQRIHRLLREVSENPDPYRDAKRQANEVAMGWLPNLRERIGAAPDPLAAAMRVAIAGNIIDLGCRTEVSEEEIRAAITRAFADPLAPEAVADFREALRSASRILYLADNAGEIVLDRLLVEQLPLERVTLAVRGGPVINDATRADADLVGLTSLVKVVDNGSDAPGTILEDCSPAFRELFERADLLIAKGQGNYETLSEAGRNIYFLLQAKCPVIARDIGCTVGKAVLRHARGAVG